jgi:acyl-CoA thioester hydrolase
MKSPQLEFPQQLPCHRFRFRVRYAETDQMGTFYNARALEWFEVGRTELSHAMGLPYREWEARGIYLPLVESYVRYLGPARYDDELEMRVACEPVGRARLRFYNEIKQVEGGRAVVLGSTLHVTVNEKKQPVKVPDWVLAHLHLQPAADGAGPT